jgi:hypothetical protein
MLLTSASDPEGRGSVPAARRLLCVLGMHRSGTSAATQLVFRLGAGVGPHLLDAMGGVNDDGFWEDSCVVDLNDRLLAALASCWQDCAPLDFAADPQAQAVLGAEAVAHFRAHYSRADPVHADQLRADRVRSDPVSDDRGPPDLWAIKDPRLCRLLPFWQKVWREEGFETCFVHVLRHPYAVAKSLHRRDRIPVEYGVALWLVYIFDALSHSVGRPGIVLAFDAFARDPLLLPRLLERRCGIEWPVATGQWEQVTTAVVKQELRHQDDSLPEQTGLRDLMTFAAAAYDTFCSAGGELPDEAGLAALRAEWQALLKRYGAELAMLRRTTDEVMALSAENVRIGTLHSEALSVIKDKDNTLEETNRLFAEAVQYRDQVIKDRDQTIKDFKQILQDIAHFRFWRFVPSIVRRISRR